MSKILVFASLLTVFAIAFVQYMYQIRSSTDYFLELGMPFPFHFVSNSLEDGLHGFRVLNFLYDVLICGLTYLVIGLTFFKLKRTNKFNNKL